MTDDVTRGHAESRDVTPTDDPHATHRACDRAPAGWKCRRKAPHDGPCAAIRDVDGVVHAVTIVTELDRRPAPSDRPHRPCVVCGCYTWRRVGPYPYGMADKPAPLCASCHLRIAASEPESP